jgi:Predicted nucleotide-utilizing enzyme related to molybdopterin-biosynthesis enzyme MoeA
MTNLSAGIIIIGNEILSGRTQDTNSNFIAKHLIKSGIELKEIIVIQDIEARIIEEVSRFSKIYTYVFTTGGIGPTHDDITSESIANAFRMKYDFHKEAFNILENYYPEGEFNEGRKKMAKMPTDAELIYNPITAAPGFKVKNVFVLPGVPEIMQKMFLQVLEKIEKGYPKKIVTINTDLYESVIALFLNDIQNKYDKEFYW